MLMSFYCRHILPTRNALLLSFFLSLAKIPRYCLQPVPPGPVTSKGRGCQKTYFLTKCWTTGGPLMAPYNSPMALLEYLSLLFFLVGIASCNLHVFWSGLPALFFVFRTSPS